MNDPKLKFLLVIIDGLGLRDETDGNALKTAETPFLDHLFSSYPSAQLGASGPSVGLPEGIMGNSEVGHLTIGAGRIIKHDLVRIDEAIQNGTLGDSRELRNVFDYVRQKKGSLHLLGLLSDGGVHSHIDHLYALLEIAKDEGIDDLFLHAVTDGRDTSPTDGIRFVEETLQRMEEIGVGTFATVAGRYYAMDRDRRWDRTERAYRTYVGGDGKAFQNPVEAVASSYEEDTTDEFIEPRIIIPQQNGDGRMGEKDALLCFNFRADRMRQIVGSLALRDFREFPRSTGPLFTTTFTRYHDAYPFPVLFQPEKLYNLLGGILESNGYHQLRVAETEKYAHVTYFLNGGEEDPYPHEERILVPSPKVATYDLQPEMSADGIRNEVLGAIGSGKYHCIIVNLANPDMVAHTGDFDAAVKAIEVVDTVAREIVEGARKRDAAVFVTSDHGNLEMMMDEKKGQVHTAHTLNSVPFVVITSGPRLELRPTGGLADISPTILDYLGIPVPAEMTGRSLLVRP